jgi:hypothetical protein
MATTNRKNICGNCKFWENDKRHMADDEGFCHRYPPTNAWSDHEQYLGWVTCIPQTYPKEWCGEWSKK